MVPAAQFDLVDAHLACRGIDQPLHVIICFRASGAAIGADRGRVGEDTFCRHLDQWRLVHAERISHRVARRRAGGAIGSADIAVPGETHRKEITFHVERQFGGHLRLAPVRVRDEATGALVSPLDWAAKLARRVEQQKYSDMFGCFMPNEPPTRSVIMRTSSRPTPSTPAM